MPSICTTCGSPFTISAEEDALRDKIGGLMPIGSLPPSRKCIDCRTMEKMAWRNERVLYRRTCDMTGKEIISVYPETAPFPVYERTEWYGDKWDGTTYGQEIAWNRPFFDQLKELQAKVPRSALNGKNTENCDYCNFAFETRNCYLTPCCYNSESLFYCYWMLDCKDCTDCSYCFECEQCIECTDCNQCYNCYQCALSSTCNDSSFLYDCRGCTECFGCVGLRKQTHCLFNEQLTKEEYQARIREFDLQNPAHAAAVQERMKQLKMKHPHRHSGQEQCEDCTGDFIFESKNCRNCYQMFRGQDNINCADSDGMKDGLDVYHPGWSELDYSGYSPVRLKTSAFFAQCWDGSNLLYCDSCQNCNDCFGCIGLQRKRHCILNKQYSEQEYMELLPRLVEYMKKTEEWGDYFPVWLSPFAYNESVAGEYLPLSREEAGKRGWRWEDKLPFTTGKETITWDKVPARIEDVSDTIIKEVLACEKCSKNYRIIKQELDFYRNKKLPLPHHCPDCRHLERVGLRNPRMLYHRACDKCGKDMETSYSPERPEIVYCEQCYLSTVY